MANEVLTRTPTSTGNRKKFTWAGWIKRNDIDASGGNSYQGIVAVGTVDSAEYTFMFSSDQIRLRCETGTDITTSEKYRDSGNWMHVMMVVDTTLFDPDHRCIFYVNGVKSDSMANAGDITQNADLRINSIDKHYIGEFPRINNHLDGQISDVFFVDGQALTPDVFGFYKDGDGYMSSGTLNATDFRPGQWMPHTPRVIKKSIERSGGFGVNGYYLPMNDSSNPGADFHCDPNSIIKLKGEDLPQPRNGAPTTSDAYVSQLRPEKEGTLGFDGVVKFDGDNDYLTIPDNEDFNIGSSDFTIELFLYKQNTSTYQHIFRQRDSGSAEMAVVLDIDSTGGDSFASGYFQMEWGSNKKFVGVNAGLNNDKWYHLALTKEGTTGRVFVDGVLVGTDTLENIGDYSADFYIGSWSGLSFYFRGFISNFRLIKGTALYTSNFTAPTEPLTNVTNTKLLCCNSVSSPIAATVTPDTITANGVVSGKNEIDTCLVLAVPGASTVIGADVVNNGYEWTGASGTTPPTGWTAEGGVATYSVNSSGQLVYDRNGDSATPARLSQNLTTVDGNTYHLVLDLVARTTGGLVLDVGSATNVFSSTTTTGIRRYTFTATSATTTIAMRNSSASGTLTIDNVKVKQVDNAPRDYSADIKGSGTNKTLTVNGNAGVGYELGGYYGSAISSSAFGDYLDAGINSDWNFGSGDFTVEFWQYNNTHGSTPGHGVWDNVNNQRSWLIYHNSSGLLRFFVSIDGASNNFSIILNEVSPTNQWNHYCMERSGSNLIGYVNGVCVGINGGLGSNSLFTPVDPLWIGRWGAGGGNHYVDGQVQDFRIYKGLAKYKGGFDVSKPYTPVGIKAFRTTADTCKNNFATLNPLGTGADLTYSNGNLTCLHGSSTTRGPSIATIGVTQTGTEKYYWEYISTSTSTNNALTGIVGLGPDITDGKYAGYTNQYGIGYYSANGETYTAYGGALAFATYGASYTNGDVIGVALDMGTNNGTLTFYKNGVSQGVAATGLGAYLTSGAIQAWVPGFGDGGSTSDVTHHVNFGQNPSFSGTVTAGTNADDSGKGLFKYAPPSGFLALCEDNLPTPAIADPGKYFKTVLYSGDNSVGRRIPVGFQPDLVWIKARNATPSHILTDSVRGIGHQISSDDPGEDVVSGSLYLNSFADNGFDLGDGANSGGNTTGRNYVAWCWKAGGAAVTNNDGTITSQVSANQTAGFSIVSYTGTASAATIGHGLNKKPNMIIVKERTSPGNSPSNWQVYHSSLGATKRIQLNLSLPADTSSSIWNDTEPTSDVFSISTSGAMNENGGTYIAYCWAEIEGFSKFGSYVGNGDADGSFVYCGFKPAWVMVKRVTTGSNEGWPIFDSSRGPTNPNPKQIYANSSIVEGDASGRYKDFVSNGFKVRGTSGEQNTSGITYVFMAFAESPFQTANAK